MARKRFKPEQIVEILREVDTTGDKKAACRKHGVTETTFYRWKRMYGGLHSTEIQRIRLLEKQNRQLKQLVGDQALANQVMREEMKKRGWI